MDKPVLWAFRSVTQAWPQSILFGHAGSIIRQAAPASGGSSRASTPRAGLSVPGYGAAASSDFPSAKQQLREHQYCGNLGTALRPNKNARLAERASPKEDQCHSEYSTAADIPHAQSMAFASYNVNRGPSVANSKRQEHAARANRRLNYTSIMPDPSRLHELVDTLPDAAIAVAQDGLEHFQTWPPSEPPQVRTIREAHRQRMRESMRHVTVAGGGGGGSYRMGPGGRIEYGHQSNGHWEGDAMVIETHRFHAGHELVIEERVRLLGGTQLAYSHEITGPDGSIERHEITFSVEPR